MKPTVEEAREHLRVDSADEDTLIGVLIDAVYEKTQAYLRRDFATEYPAELPAPIKVAILLQVGTLFSNREATGEAQDYELAFGYKDLLASYRVFS